MKISKIFSNIYRLLILISVFFEIPDSFAREIGSLAKEKCEAYSQLVYNTEYSPTLKAQAKKETNSKCRIVAVPLIIGGVKADAREFPHMAVIGFGFDDDKIDSLAWLCGGSVISENYILTAAHCISHREKGDAAYVRVGLINMETTGSHVQTIEVSERISHPKYSAKSKYNDIALLKLANAIHFSEYVRPGCLNTDKDLNWSTALATGFGRLTYESEAGSVDLMKVQLSQVSQKDCRETYKTHRSMTDNVQDTQLCAGEIAGKKDTCQGDSGGPLQIVLEKPYCMYSIIGVTSFGKFCGFANSPGIYTNVASYVEWIEEIVWPN